MSPSHKAALAVGRDQGRAVRRYLEALDAGRPKRGRPRSSDTITRRLAAIEKSLPAAGALKRLQLTQERMDLQSQLTAAPSHDALAEAEADFVAVAAVYGRRKRITYAAWRAVGVEPRVLTAAGVARRP